MSTISWFPIGWRHIHVSLSLLLKRLWSWLVQMFTTCVFPIGCRNFNIILSLILKRLCSRLCADVYHMLVSYWMAPFSYHSEFDTEEVMELAWFRCLPWWCGEVGGEAGLHAAGSCLQALQPLLGIRRHHALEGKYYGVRLKLIFEKDSINIFFALSDFFCFPIKKNVKFEQQFPC